MVKCVKQLGSELQIAVLIDSDFLRNRKIEICEAGTTHDADAGITKRLGSGTRHRKGIGVEPSLNSALRASQLGVSDEIWPCDSITAKIKNSGSTQSWCQWQTALDNVNTGNLPIPQDQIRRAVPRPAPPFVPSPGHLAGRVGRRGEDAGGQQADEAEDRQTTRTRRHFWVPSGTKRTRA